MKSASGVCFLACGLAAVLSLAGCGGGSSEATVGGTLTGLSAGSSLTLQDNDSDSLALSSNGPFTFVGTVASGEAYNVDVPIQPVGQTCSIENGSGTVDVESDSVNTVVVSCIVSSSLGGTVSGLPAGTSVTLSNGGVQLPIAANGTFAFAGTLPAGSTYDVIVVTQPLGHTCTLASPSGTVAADVMAAVLVSCA
jgi:hypothetical protein